MVCRLGDDLHRIHSEVQVATRAKRRHLIEHTVILIFNLDKMTVA